VTGRGITPWDAPAWFSKGACRRKSNVDFFAEDKQAITRAKSLCAECQVAAECLAFAVERGEVGVWGGTTRRERRGLRMEERLRRWSMARSESRSPTTS
jgi:hypothetical protein